MCAKKSLNKFVQGFCTSKVYPDAMSCLPRMNLQLSSSTPASPGVASKPNARAAATKPDVSPPQPSSMNDGPSPRKSRPKTQTEASIFLKSIQKRALTAPGLLMQTNSIPLLPAGHTQAAWKVKEGLTDTYNDYEENISNDMNSLNLTTPQRLGRYGLSYSSTSLSSLNHHKKVGAEKAKEQQNFFKRMISGLTNNIFGVQVNDKTLEPQRNPHKNMNKTNWIVKNTTNLGDLMVLSDDLKAKIRTKPKSTDAVEEKSPIVYDPLIGWKHPASTQLMNDDSVPYSRSEMDEPGPKAVSLANKKPKPGNLIATKVGHFRTLSKVNLNLGLDTMRLTSKFQEALPKSSKALAPVIPESLKHQKKELGPSVTMARELKKQQEQIKLQNIQKQKEIRLQKKMQMMKEYEQQQKEKNKQIYRNSSGLQQHLKKSNAKIPCKNPRVQDMRKSSFDSKPTFRYGNKNEIDASVEQEKRIKRIEKLNTHHMVTTATATAVNGIKTEASMRSVPHHKSK